MDKLDFEKISIKGRNTSVDKAINLIRYKIITQEYKKGEYLTEVELSNECQTSRGTIRIALQELERQGLIETQMNGRKRVVGFDSSYIEDLYEMRIIIETKAIKKILSNERLRIQFLSKGFKIIDEIHNIKNNPKEKHNRLDYEIHDAIVKISENQILIQCWNTFLPVLRTMLKINSLIGEEKVYLKEYYGAHNEIINLISNNDIKAIDAIEKHLLSSKKIILDTLKKILK